GMATSGVRLFIAGSGTVNFSYYITGGVSAPLAVSSQPYNDGRWHYSVGTFDGSQITLYVDGVRVGAASSTNPIEYGSGFTRIGSTAYSSQLFTGSLFGGRLDDVRVYNRPLIPSEVNQLYASAAFTRFFSIENICRATTGLNQITGVTSSTSCSSGILDPSTQKIAAYTRWLGGSNIGEVRIEDYVTRWKNSVFRQTDWSGGAGVSGPTPESLSSFSTSTNVNFSEPGFIQIQGF
ncbi:LamG domain-containing protein, partial [Candidatus Jorgensenbacteria bacterium]|nr:LamG domain-containing protein [Candidatus Jorgensenbacteria bacterium]